MRITVNDPCQQTWESLNKEDGKAYCQVCRKHVIDFTGRSRQSIETYIATHPGKVCGRFRKDQLDTTPAGLSHKLAPVLLAAGLSMAASAVQARPLPDVPNSEQTVGHMPDQTTGGSADSVVVTGRVLDPSGEPILGAMVWVDGSSHIGNGVATDPDGMFTLTTARTDTAISVGTVGYDTKTVPLEHQMNPSFTTVIMAEPLTITEVVIGGLRVQPFYKRWWYRIKNIFGRRFP